MATIEQIDDLNHFIETLPQSERDSLSMDEIYERWREQAFKHDDLLAIKASVRDYESGERGRPVDEFLADIDAEALQRAPGKGK
jgi:hypothetical protein